MQTKSFVTLSAFALFSASLNATLQDSIYKHPGSDGQFTQALPIKNKGNAPVKSHLTYTKTPTETGTRGGLSSNTAPRNYDHAEVVTRETMYVEGKMNMR